jgi:hypothetical protein
MNSPRYAEEIPAPFDLNKDISISVYRLISTLVGYACAQSGAGDCLPLFHSLKKPGGVGDNRLVLILTQRLALFLQWRILDHFQSEIFGMSSPCSRMYARWLANCCS